MTIIEKPSKTRKTVPSLREIANTQDVVWYSASRYQQPVRATTLPLSNVTTVEDAQWRKLTPFELAMRPVTNFFKW
jgi:hypothetical protein